MMIARLRQRVTIEQLADTEDGRGGYAVDWTTVATNVWARIEPLKPSERLEAGSRAETITHRITMRYRAGLTGQMRIVHRGTPYNIVGPPVNADERQRYLTLDVEEGVPT